MQQTRTNPPSEPAAGCQRSGSGTAEPPLFPLDERTTSQSASQEISYPNDTPSNRTNLPSLLLRAGRNDLFPLPRTSTEIERSDILPSDVVTGTKRHLSPNSTPEADEGRRSRRKRARLAEEEQAGKHCTSIRDFESPRKGDNRPIPPFSEQTHHKRRTSSPSDFSISQAAATMLGRREGSGGIRTVQLARGHASSPVRHVRSGPRRSSSDRSSDLSSTQESPSQNTSQILAQIGILELLQQDERPTFIIDLADAVNLQPGFLKLLFVNTALKTRPELLEYVRGVGDNPCQAIASPSTFDEFKQWAVSFVKNGEAPAVSVPSYPYAGFVWTCSTLRKRLRVISCDPRYAPPSQSGSPTSSTMRHSQGLRSSPLAGSGISKEEASDYFGPEMSFPTVQNPVNSTATTARDASESADKYNSTGSALIASPVSNGDIESMEALINRRSPSQQTESNFPPETPVLNGHTEVHNVIPDEGFFDWTRLPESSALPPHIRFARSVDWAATSLGPIECWGADLRAMCNLIMASPHPAAMYW